MKNLILTVIFIFCFSIFAFAQVNLPCPKIEVHGPSSLVNAGETITFSANVDGKTPDSNLEFEWTVSAGTIIDQQGKPEIRVMTTEEMAGSNLTATVKVKGIFENCNNEASEIAVIESLLEVCLFPYEKMSLEEELGRFDNLLFTLQNNPGARTHILFEIDKTENLSEVKTRVTKVFDHIFGRRKFSRNLFFFDICYADHTQTTFRIIPDGVEIPSFLDCEKVEIDLK